MYHDAIAFEIENVTGWNLMQVLAAEMMESTETSVVIENTRAPPEEEIKDNPEELSADVSTTSSKTETTPSTDVSKKTQERLIPSTDVSATAEETRMPITGVSTTSKKRARISIEVSAASEKHEMSPVVPVTSPDVSNGPNEKAPSNDSTDVSTTSGEPHTRSTFVPTTAYETKLSTVQTEQNETSVQPPVLSTGATDPSPTAPFKTEHVIGATLSETLTERPSEVGAQEGDKCRTGTHDCSSNGICIPLDESYDCECNQGFEGDGRICAGMLICFLFLIFSYSRVSVNFLLAENVYSEIPAHRTVFK